MTITDSHLVAEATQSPIAGGSPMAIRRVLVIHFTAGATAQSSIASMRATGLSAHFVIDRDGTLYQCRPCNRTAAHAGKSRWQDPRNGTRYEGLNTCSIGIELANAGDTAVVIKWAREKSPHFAGTITARHRNGGGLVEWEEYPKAQLATCLTLAKALVDHYHLDDITGHDCIAPERKNDPGPAFPMANLRAHCGFGPTLPVVHRV